MPKGIPIPPPDDNDPLQVLSPIEIMRILRVGRSQIDRLVATGQLRSVTVSQGLNKRRYRVRRSVLEAWIKKTEKGGSKDDSRPSCVGPRSWPEFPGNDTLRLVQC